MKKHTRPALGGLAGSKLGDGGGVAIPAALHTDEPETTSTVSRRRRVGLPVIDGNDRALAVVQDTRVAVAKLGNRERQWNRSVQRRVVCWSEGQ